MTEQDLIKWEKWLAEVPTTSPSRIHSRMRRLLDEVKLQDAMIKGLQVQNKALEEMWRDSSGNGG